jgi:hypothetical protein
MRVLITTSMSVTMSIRVAQRRDSLSMGSPRRQTVLTIRKRLLRRGIASTHTPLVREHCQQIKEQQEEVKVVLLF